MAAINGSLLAWPVRFASTSLGLRLTIIGFAAQTVTLSATLGRNYWMVGDGQADSDGGFGGIGDALKVLEAALNTNGHGATFTVSLTAGFQVLVTIGTGNFFIQWGDAATDPTLPGIFGYAASSTVTGGSCTGGLQPQGLWRPTKPLGTDTRNREPTIAGVAAAGSGAVRVASLIDHPKRERTVTWNRVVQELALIEYQTALTPTGSFEWAWINSIKLGRALRLYEDETSRTLTSYGLYRIHEEGLKKDPLVRLNPSISNTRWNVGPLILRAA